MHAIQCRQCVFEDARSDHGSSTWLIYLDDILVYSTDPWEHMEHLRKVVQANTKAEIRIQPKKTKIFQSEVEYLRLKVDQRWSSNTGRLHQGMYRNGHAQLAARRCLHSSGLQDITL